VFREPVAQLRQAFGGNFRVRTGGGFFQEQLVGPDGLDRFRLVPAGFPHFAGEELPFPQEGVGNVVVGRVQAQEIVVGDFRLHVVLVFHAGVREGELRARRQGGGREPFHQDLEMLDRAAVFFFRQLLLSAGEEDRIGKSRLFGQFLGTGDDEKGRGKENGEEGARPPHGVDGSIAIRKSQC